MRDRKFGGNVRMGMNGKLLFIREIVAGINAHFASGERRSLKLHWPLRTQQSQNCGTLRKMEM